MCVCGRVAEVKRGAGETLRAGGIAFDNGYFLKATFPQFLVRGRACMVLGRH